MKVVIKILRGILAVLLIAILGLNVWLFVQQNVMKKDAPEVFGYSQYIVTSGSMEPTICTGDMILVKKQPSYELDEVVVFIDPSGQTVTHRLVGRVEGQFITQGDANNVEDNDLLPPEKIVGKVLLDLPGAGRAALFLRSPLGLLLILLVGFLLCMLPEWLTRPFRSKSTAVEQSAPGRQPAPDRQPAPTRQSAPATKQPAPARAAKAKHTPRHSK